MFVHLVEMVNKVLEIMLSSVSSCSSRAILFTSYIEFRLYDHSGCVLTRSEEILQLETLKTLDMLIQHIQKKNQFRKFFSAICLSHYGEYFILIFSVLQYK